MSESLKILNTIIPSDIPTYMVGLSYNYFGNGGSPAATSNNRYFTAVKHLVYIYKFIKGSLAAPLGAAQATIIISFFELLVGLD